MYRKSGAAAQHSKTWPTDPRRIFRACRFGLHSRRAVWEAIALAFSYHPKPRFRLRSGRRGLDCRHTFFNQIPPDLPILEGRKQEPVRFFAVRRLVALKSFFTGVLRGSLQFACGFCCSPRSASPLCSSAHHFSILCPLVVIRIAIRQRPRQTFPLGSYLNSGAAPKVSLANQRRAPVVAESPVRSQLVSNRQS